MAKDPSFDVVSEVDMQEMDNAVNQVKKEIIQRYDFKGSAAEIDLLQKEQEINLTADSEQKLAAMIDILQSKAVKRNLSLKVFEYGKIEYASGNKAKQKIKIKCGIDKERAKKIINDIKGAQIKVQAQIADDIVRVTSKNIDDLQTIIQMLKEKDYDLPLQFINFRSK
ncbi:MAG: YajQ family cyclic di-GMP-binding protein [Clostridia bacterium]